MRIRQRKLSTHIDKGSNINDIFEHIEEKG